MPIENNSYHMYNSFQREFFQTHDFLSGALSLKNNKEYDYTSTLLWRLAVVLSSNVWTANLVKHVLRCEQNEASNEGKKRNPCRRISCLEKIIRFWHCGRSLLTLLHRKLKLISSITDSQAFAITTNSTSIYNANDFCRAHSLWIIFSRQSMLCNAILKCARPKKPSCQSDSQTTIFLRLPPLFSLHLSFCSLTRMPD